MSSPIPQPTTAIPLSNPQTQPPLSGRILALAQVVWWILFGAIAVMNLIALPLNLQVLQRECVSPPCFDQQLNLVLLRSWLLMGFSRETYANLAVAIGLYPTITSLTVAFILFRSKPNERVVFFASLMLMLFGGVTYSGFLSVLGRENSLWWVPVLLFDYLGSITVIAFYYIFPNGQFVPRWTRIVLALWALEELLQVLTNPPIGWNILPRWISDVTFLVAAGSAVFAQLYRYRRVSSGAERRQTKWVVFGTITALVGVMSALLIFSAFAVLQENVVADVILSVMLAVFVSLIPISIGIAILRSRLWDINLIINRTIVYGSVTAILAGVLAVSSDLTKRFFLALTGESSELAPIVATLIIVAAFEPIKKRVQGFVDRHVKYATGSFGAFGEELDQFVELNDPNALSRRFLKEALTTFGANSGAIYFGQGTHMRLVSSAGQWDGHAALAAPMEHAGTNVGLVALGARANGEAYDDDHRATLRQMSDLVAHAITLAQNLKHDATPVQSQS